MRLDDENRRNHQPRKARLSQISSQPRRLPSRTALSIVLGGHEGYHAATNRGSSGECRLEALTKDKWLEFHCLEHWTEYYTDYGVNLQMKFFDYFLKGEDTGWKLQPPVLIQVMQVEGSWQPRNEQEWPLKRTRWTKLFLDAAAGTLAETPARDDTRIDYGGLSEGTAFVSPPLAAETELTGPIAAKLFVSSATDDADIFVVVRVFNPELKEVTFQGHTDPHTTVAQGWLRASHR